MTASAAGRPQASLGWGLAYVPTFEPSVVTRTKKIRGTTGRGRARRQSDDQKPKTAKASGTSTTTPGHRQTTSREESQSCTLFVLYKGVRGQLIRIDDARQAQASSAF